MLFRQTHAQNVILCRCIQYQKQVDGVNTYFVWDESTPGPGNAANAVIMVVLLKTTAPVLAENEFRYLTDKVYDGNFASETGMLQYLQFVECVHFLKEEMGVVFGAMG